MATSKSARNALEANCLMCHKLFLAIRPHHVYCSQGCRQLAWEKRNPRVKLTESLTKVLDALKAKS